MHLPTHYTHTEAIGGRRTRVEHTDQKNIPEIICRRIDRDRDG